MQTDELRINDALRAKETLIFSANCSIAYNGRAQSYLGFGDRLIMIKQDGTLLVHTPFGASPVNYMKGGATHRLKNVGGHLVITSRSSAQKEFMEITIRRIHFIESLTLLDQEKLLLAGTEKDMSDMIFENPSLISPGFRPLSREEHTKFGFIDVFGYDRDGDLVVVECKRDKADFAAVSQLERYVHRIKKAKGLSKVQGVIAAPTISANAETMLREKGYAFKRVEPPRFLEQYGKSQSRLGDF
ncbi:MAG: DUF91 domain-containing protein [DPANN group archaeon]|nr:DUF91 domain-containing protein [DPANN group archaeon]